MHAAETFGVGTTFFGITDRRDAFFERFENGIRLLAEHHLFRVLEEVAHGDRHAFEKLGKVGLDFRGSSRTSNGFARDGSDARFGPRVLNRSLGHVSILYAPRGSALTPPIAAAIRAADDWRNFLRSTGSSNPTISATNPTKVRTATTP